MNERLDALNKQLAELEAGLGEPMAWCEFCGSRIFRGDRYHHGYEVDLCDDCAPTWRDMLARPEDFRNEDGETMTAAEVRAKWKEHEAEGGSIDDKLVD